MLVGIIGRAEPRENLAAAALHDNDGGLFGSGVAPGSEVFAGDLRFGVAPSELRLQDVLRSVLAEQNVPKAEHAPERSEERAQLVTAR